MKGKIAGQKQNKKLKGLKCAAALSLAMFLAGTMTGCGGSGGQNTASKADMSIPASVGSASGMANFMMESPAQEDLTVGGQLESVPEELGEEGAASRIMSDRKLIRTVDLSVETREFDRMIEELDRQVEAVGGYVEYRSTYNGSLYSTYRSQRSADMTIRIPQDKLDGFLDAVDGISNVISRNDRVDDITLTYVDLKSHKEALETEQARLLELLAKAQSVEDIITIEERLSNVRYQIESMESQLRTFDNQVDYSTVTMNIQEVKELTPASKESAWEQIRSGFVDSLYSIGRGAEEIGIWLLVNSPYLLILGVVLILVVLAARRQMRRGGTRRGKKDAQNADGKNGTDMDERDGSGK